VPGFLALPGSGMGGDGGLVTIKDRNARGLKCFSFRGKAKVNAQWLFYCLVHNICKVQRYERIAKPLREA
jgi:hypothetical protein